MVVVCPYANEWIIRQDKQSSKLCYRKKRRKKSIIVLSIIYLD